MTLQWQNSSVRHTLLTLTACLLGIVLVSLMVLGEVFTRFDFAVLDALYRYAVQHGWGPRVSSQIVYVPISDASYDVLNTNTLDRTVLATANDILDSHGAAAVAYDILFARRSSPAADAVFATSLQRLPHVYLPMAFRHTQRQTAFRWQEGIAYERLRHEHMQQLAESGAAQPVYAVAARMPLDSFAQAAAHTGNISKLDSDADGVYRHVSLLIKIDTGYFPALALAMFLHHVQVPFGNVRIQWGRAITIPATPGSHLAQDVVIPIDAYGRTFIPYPQVWGRDFAHVPLHTLLDYSTQAALQGNLTDLLEGKFVFIGDVATGTADMGHTPLEENVPLLIVHAALLNALLTNTFYHQWTFWQVLWLLCGLSLLLAGAVLVKTTRLLYTLGGLVVLGLMALTVVQFWHFTLFPVVTVGLSFVFLFVGLLIGLHFVTSRDAAFVRNAFARFVNQQVVDELVEHPEFLQLGGEERVLTVLFSDIEGFTSIAERMAPTALVHWLNSYLTEMTAIIMDEGGTVDKFIGDGIMAEFGAPMHFPDHADRAVRAALRMHKRLPALHTIWAAQGLPAARTRIGINTGMMLVGNMGSERVFNYTVTGDAVNVAARLEGANKQYDSVLMIAESTHTCLTPGLFRTRLLDAVTVKGRENAEPIKVFEVYGDMSEPCDSQQLAYYEAYDAGAKAYCHGDWRQAQQYFTTALQQRPADVAAQYMLSRLHTLHTGQQPAEWAEVNVLELR